MIQIHDGKLDVLYEPYDLPGAMILLQYQLRVHGRPAPKFNYRGEGGVYDHPTQRGKKIVAVGGATSPGLAHYDVDDQPTPESARYEMGYRKGFKAKRMITFAAAEKMDVNELDGWRDGWRDGRK